jgi:ABC-type uncharacterized transport system auxiliary subunit
MCTQIRKAGGGRAAIPTGWSAPQGRALFVLAGVLAALALAGCLSGPPPVVTDHTLDYPPPAFPGLAPLAVQLNVELHGATDPVDKTDMLYRQKPFSLNAYTYDRWAASPVTLLQSFLVRDLHMSGLFAGVFDYRTNLRARYLLTGSLEEFYEADSGETGRGRLRLTVSLLDLGDRGTGQALLFQRSYAAEGPETSQDAGGLAASMSEAVREVSTALIPDVHSALEGSSNGGSPGSRTTPGASGG